MYTRRAAGGLLHYIIIWAKTRLSPRGLRPSREQHGGRRRRGRRHRRVDAVRGRQQQRADRRLQWRRRRRAVGRDSRDAAVEQVHGVRHRVCTGGQHLVVTAAGPADREAHLVVYDPVQHVREHAARRRAGYVRHRHYVTWRQRKRKTRVQWCLSVVYEPNDNIISCDCAL